MRKASTELLQQGIQAPSLAPDLIPAEPLINRELTFGTGTANGGTSGRRATKGEHQQPCGSIL
jgi:hypothetical protein